MSREPFDFSVLVQLASSSRVSETHLGGQGGLETAISQIPKRPHRDPIRGEQAVNKLTHGQFVQRQG